MACWESREARVTRQSAQRRGAGRGKQSLGLAGHSGPGHGESSQIRGLFLQCLCTAVLNVLSGPRVGDPPPSREGPQIPPPHLPGPAITGSPATKTLPNPAGLGWLEEFSEIQRRDRASRVASAGLWSSGSRRLGRGGGPDWTRVGRGSESTKRHACSRDQRRQRAFQPLTAGVPLPTT